MFVLMLNKEMQRRKMQLKVADSLVQRSVSEVHLEASDSLLELLSYCNTGRILLEGIADAHP